MTVPVDQAARADALRNRARVLRAAQQAFAGEGSSVSLERIARLAGLGAGTVYRHFPSKESLLEAVLVQRIDELVARAARWGAQADPGQALFGFLSDVVELTGDHKGLCDALQVDTSWPRVAFTAAGRRFDQSLSRLLRAAQRAGAVRDDVTTGEVSTLLLGCAVMRRAHPGSEGLVRRVLDTVRPDPGSVTEHSLRDIGRSTERPVCAACGAALRSGATGRPARYCGPTCRQRAHRQRARAVG